MAKRILKDAAQPMSDGYSLPSPVGGWNARDQLARMPPTDAVVLDNWFPQSTDIVVRPGFTNRATGPVGETIQSLLGLSKYNGTFKRFIATQTGIYDASLDGIVGPAVSPATSGVWQHVQINVGGVSFLWTCCGDGVNNARIYNADTEFWTILTGASAPVLTGPVSADVANVSMFKNRLVLTIRNSMKVWYSPLNSVGGVFQSFDLGAVFKRGGYIMATGNWTVDAGDGPDDRFVAITSEGEMVVYQGIDPASDFTLVGVYYIGKPIGRRCLMQMGSELVILTEQGLWPISKALQSATIDRRVAMTDKIQSAFNQAIKLYGTLAGWEAQLLSKGPAILVNVPFGTGSWQYVMNTITGSWCRFRGWDATCMLVQDGKFFFANGNVVMEGWTGTQDGTAGIYAYAKTAYSYGRSPQSGKKVNMVRPVMTTTDDVNINLAIDTDFQTNAVTSSVATVSLGSTLWDTGVFDTDVWGGGVTQIKRWRTVSGDMGKTFSLRLGLNVKGIEVSWSATDFILEAGGLMT